MKTMIHAGRAFLRDGFLFAVLTAVVLTVGAPQATALEVFLRAEATTKALPVPGGGTADVAMWGFARDASFDPADPGDRGAVTVPGPMLTVPPGDPELVIHLDNNLAVPVSITVPGLTPLDPPAPVRVAGRAVSLSHETAPGNAAPVTYRFKARDGSFLYHSASHMQVQVQMGLYGGVVRDAAAGVAYAGTAPYSGEVVLFLSEVDPAIHAAVAVGEYGPGGTIQSAIGYKARHFLVNGQTLAETAGPLAAGPSNQATLVRIFNAGLITHVPVLLGADFQIIGESGNRLAYPRSAYSAPVFALQTVDALVSPGLPGTYAIFDRAQGLADGSTIAGGILRKLEFGPPEVAPAPATPSPVQNAIKPRYIKRALPTQEVLIRRPTARIEGVRR